MSKISDLSQLLSRSIALLKQQMRELEKEGGNEEEQELIAKRWQRIFGKDSVVAVLAKLVQMHKQLEELAANQPDEAQDATKPLSEAEWDWLEQCLARHRAKKTE
ncbi:MAG: hypothetical protein MRY32_04435 [Rickettsiales bacterium]|nr:hypothetical protein [Rickettsiales bacterium]